MNNCCHRDRRGLLPASALAVLAPATFAGDVMEVLRQLPPRPVLVDASLGGITSMLLAGELAPGTVRAVVLVDIVPNMDASGGSDPRVHE